MAGRLIITNGDVTAQGIRDAGISGDVIAWRDVLHEGPVPRGLLLEALSLVRAPYLAAAFGKPLTEVNRDFVERDALVRRHPSYDTVELWFEHDLYDQLQLIQLLDFFASERRTEGVFIMQADDYLGAMRAPSLRDHDGIAQAVTPEQVTAAAAAWKAFTAPNPDAMLQQAVVDCPAMPYLRATFARLMQELPAIGSGLSLTQERIVTALMDQPRTVAATFGATQVWEDARFLGDASFFRQIDDLAFAATPLLEGLPFRSTGLGDDPEAALYTKYAQSAVTVTDAGREAFAGRFDHAIENGIDRWIGGTHLTVGSLWRRRRDDTLLASTAI
jgi:hypothetical protein